jgi:hypothetical protein
VLEVVLLEVVLLGVVVIFAATTLRARGAALFRRTLLVCLFRLLFLVCLVVVFMMNTVLSSC